MSLLYQIALSLLPGIGSVLARNLISAFGSAEDVMKARKDQLAKVPGLGPKTASVFKDRSTFVRAEAEIEFIRKQNIKPLFLTDAAYPKRLKNCNDAPVMLYYKGSADLNCPKVISIVGTRNATEYGRELCKALLSELKVHKPLIVSGLAYGIDSLAHREALRNDIPTVGVLAHGLDRIYPSQHLAIADRMISQGGLITEFTSATRPDRENFPRRNRIIAGLADLTIVVEANVKGGALITAELANSYNRDVFAFPGRANDLYSAGCNYLIRTNRANLITCVSDLEYMLNWTANDEVQPQKQQLSLPIDLSGDEQTIAGALGVHGTLAVDDLAGVTGFTQSRLAVTILGMEMRGLLVSLPGKVYRMA